MKKICVSKNKRFLMYEDGKPFFYLADTAWELFHRLDKSAVEYYLQDRVAKKFTVIQAVVLAECEGLSVPNTYGHTPFRNNDPTQINEAYFEYVDYVVKRANQLGLVIGMLPTWGDKWNKKWGAGPEIFTPENAKIYGNWLGRRYKDADIIWIVGGDRILENETHYKIIESMAIGLRAGDEQSHLISFHPQGGRSSSEYWQNAPWLDFNMLQTGHDRNSSNYECIAADYARTPTKPCIDGEPSYENHPAGFDLNAGYLDDYDVRKGLYWALFAGAFGHTYGCHDIWQMWQEDKAPINFVRTPWREALHFAGSAQVQHARTLLESRPFFSRIPDQSMIISEVKDGTYHVQAVRDQDGSYALIYLPVCEPLTINTSKLTGKSLAVYWYDPRTGNYQPASTIENKGEHTFTPPPVWPDWILVLDDAERNYL